MRITDEQLQAIYDGMDVIAWKELGRLHLRQPLGMSIHTKAGRVLGTLGLAEFVGRENTRHSITELGAAIWENHRPAAYHRRRR